MLAAWTHGETQLLIATYADLKEDIGDRVKKRADIFRRISSTMSTHGYHRDGAECDKKWRSLMKTYRRNLDNSKKTGQGGGKQWPYFATMHDIMGKCASAMPISVTAVPKRLIFGPAQLMTQNATPVDDSVIAETPCRAAESTQPKPTKRSQPPEWFSSFMEESRKDQAKRHSDFMDHLKRTEQAQKERTDVIKAILEKFSK